MDKVEKAYLGYKAAAERYIKAVAEKYPVGAILTLKKGNAVFQGKILRHSMCWWVSPGHFLVQNIKTLKMREVEPSNVLEKY